MLIKLHSQHFRLTPSIKRFVEENLQAPVEQVWRKDGAWLDVDLRDVRGGDKQGIDHECRCVIHLPNAAPVVITEVTDDMRTSIHQARKRLVRRIREYGERRERRATRPSPRRPLAAAARRSESNAFGT